MKSYLRIVCGFVYGESVGMPDDGFPAGTKWSDIPAGWDCPDCVVAKADCQPALSLTGLEGPIDVLGPQRDPQHACRLVLTSVALCLADSEMR